MTSILAFPGKLSRESRQDSHDRMGAGSSSKVSNAGAQPQNYFSRYRNNALRWKEYFSSSFPGIPISRNQKTRFTPDNYAYLRNLMSKFSQKWEKRVEMERREHTSGQKEEKMSKTDRETRVELVEFYVVDNAKEHHTDMYGMVHEGATNPVLRRGQQFFMAVKFWDKSFDINEDKLNLVFTYGPSPSQSKGTKVVLPVAGNKGLKDPDSGMWSAKVFQNEDTLMTIQVQIPPHAPVGIWRCTVETYKTLQGHQQTRRDSSQVKVDELSRARSATPERSAELKRCSQKDEYQCNEDIYILFNPWSREDPVHMDNEMWRREYVLNETGKIWIGTHKNSKGRRWAYGQFDDIVLPTCMYLMEMGQVNHNERGNPVKVVRAIAEAVNGRSEYGLMDIRYDGNYLDGVPPCNWTGSVKIMEEYMRQGGKPVKYGQCWIFAGLVTTICRALGIPCRPVSNFLSAHDTNKSMTIDKYFDLYGERIESGLEGDANDTIWSFHVWNDVWMTRPDLSMGYGGWQAIDSTPQRNNDDYYRCGPASLEAIRRGEIGQSYDTGFLYSEVNSEIMHWFEDFESDWGFYPMKSNQKQAGMKILTRRPDREDEEDDNDMEDILYLYRKKDLSNTDKLTTIYAMRGFDKDAQYPMDFFKHQANDDVVYTFNEVDKVQMGNNFNVSFHVQNRSSEQRTVTLNLSICSMYYTGIKARPIKQQSQQFILKPNQKETLSFRVNSEDYVGKLVDHDIIRVYAVGFTKETKQGFYEEDEFVLEKPRLSIQTRGGVQVGQELSITFSFSNPLNVTLTDCKFMFEAPGVQRPKCVRFREVKPGEMVTHQEKFFLKHNGERKIVACFSSKELFNINGYKTINVRD